MFRIYQKRKTLMMIIQLILMCFLRVKSIHGLTLNRLNERLGYIEDRINAESKFRRDDFSTLFNEINSLKEMIQVSLESKMEGKETKHTDHAKEGITKELEEKIRRLTIGFKEEKMTNIRLRRKTHELYRKVAEFKFQADKTTGFLERLLTGVEILANRKEEREHCPHPVRENISEIKINVKKITDSLEKTKKQEEQKFDRLHTYAENIIENIQHLKVKQKLCLEKVNITMEERNVNEMINSEEHKVCSCSNVSFLEPSMPTPEQHVAYNKSCKDLYINGVKSNGIYHIDIGEEKPLSVYCDMDTDDGGWTVFQRRQDGSVDFFRDWNAYRNGFGDLNGELWLGNKFLNLLTDDDQQHELRIDLEDFDGNRVYAKYNSFKVQSEDMKYTLEVSGYAGNAGDSLEAPGEPWEKHDNMQFSTKDEDNDKSSNNCASRYKGAWWFNRCFASNLNSLYSQKAVCKEKWKCIIWNTWKGSQTSMKFSEMKLR